MARGEAKCGADKQAGNLSTYASNDVVTSNLCIDKLLCVTEWHAMEGILDRWARVRPYSHATGEHSTGVVNKNERNVLMQYRTTKYNSTETAYPAGDPQSHAEKRYLCRETRIPVPT